MKRKIAMVLVAIFILGMILPSMVMATDIKDNQNKLNNINKDVKNVESKLGETKKEQKDIKSEIAQLDKQLAEANTKLNNTKAELEKTNRDLDEAKEELSKAEAEMKEQNEALEERMRVMYKNGNVAYIEVLLDSTSFSDFMSRMDVIKRIMDYDNELLADLKIKKEEIETKKEKIEKEQQRIITLKNQLENKAKEVKTIQVSRQKYLNSVNGEIKAYEKEVRDLKNDAAQAKRIIQAAIAKQEAERKKQEEANKNNGNSGGGSSSNVKPSGRYSWPVPGYHRISSAYGWRIHPIRHTKSFHTGVDIPAPTGRALIAVGNGVVTYSGYLGGYGKVVMVDLGGGMSMLGAHNSSLLVSTGQKVSKGQTIAKIGSTGNSTGPHSHFEIRKNGDHISPLPYVR